MKVGILTFSRVINYGAALQAIALQHTLREQGSEASLIDYRCEAIDSTSKLFDFKEILNVPYVIAHVANLPFAYKRKKAFQGFWNRYCQFTNEAPERYDIIVTGSDQVWNYNLTGHDMFYYLDFEKKNTKKVAYAASFGLSSIPEEKYDTLRPLLEDFDYLSVREKTAAKIVNDICGRDIACTVLDPTLLLHKTQWEEMSDPAIQISRYIFVYTVFNSDSLWAFAEQLSRETGLPIKTVSYSRFHQHKAEYIFTAGPAQWLGYMLRADYVVTNSFHGMAFSVNFQKNFFYELPPSSSGVSSRLADMAERYGLQEREIGEVTLDSAIDWQKVDQKLEKDRRSSVAFIQKFTRK